MNESLSPVGSGGNAVYFSRRDWITLAVSLGLAALWFSVFGLEHLFRAYVPAGLGTTLYVLALFSAVLFRLGRRAVWNRTTALLAAACVLLAVNCCIYTNSWVAMINCVILLGTGALEFFALAGRLECAPGSARSIGCTLRQSAAALFTNMDKPFRALGRMNPSGRKRLGGAVLGAVLTAPVLAVVLALLVSADVVFGSIFAGISDWLESMNIGTLIWRVVRTAVLGLMLFSALYYLTAPTAPLSAGGQRTFAPATPFITALTLLDAVYAVFVFIQLAFLFGGRQMAALSGGYAEYARSGFFQLVAVAAINLAVVLITSLCVHPCGRGVKALRVLSSILLGFTAVILASSLYRMCLYISVYGLSFLRALTLFGIAFIAVLLIAAWIKVFRPQTRFWPVFLAAGLSIWLVFAYVNIDARIAEYNVDAYLSGELDEIDIDYLTQSLAPESLPSIKKLAAMAPELCRDSGIDLWEAADSIENRLLDTVNWREATLTAIRYALS